MADVQIAEVNTPVGPLSVEKVPNLQDRTKAIYWRPFRHKDGRIEWMPTLPLPADSVGREHYLSKGFRLDNPNAPKPAAAPVVDEEKERLYAELAAMKVQIEELKQAAQPPVAKKHPGGRPKKA